MKVFAFGKGSPTKPGRCANNYRQRLFWAGSIGLAVLAVYYPVIGFEFLNYDDPINVYENQLVTSFSLNSLQRFWGGYFSGLYIPLVYTIWGILAKVAQLVPASSSALNPFPFHLTNLGLHIASALLIFKLLRRLGFMHQSAAVGSLFFAFHPLQVEAVAWVTGLKDLLSGFLALLAIYYYLRHLQRNQELGGHYGGWRDYSLTGCFFLLALLAKPSTVTVPVLAGVLGYFCTSYPFRKLARELLPLLALALLLAMITIAAQPGGQFPLTLSFWQRTLIAADALNFYVGKLFWPATLGPDYGRMLASILTSPRVSFTLLTPVVLGVAVYLGRHKCWLPAGLLIFALALLPVLGFLPFTFQKTSTVADRYMYLAMLGPALLMAMGWELLPARTARFVLLILLAGLAARSTVQVRAWQNSFTLNNLALQVNPASTIAYNNLGAAHDKVGNFQEAQEAYLRAIAIDPFSPDAYHNLGSLYTRVGFHQEALENFEKALPLAPRSPAHVQLHIGNEHRALGNFASARNSYLQALDNGRLEQLGFAEMTIIYASLSSLPGVSGDP